MRYASVVFPAALALTFAACSDVQQPVGPSTRLSDGVSQSVSPNAASNKTEICHATGDGSFILISVAAPALDAHFAHGDGRIGDLVPGQPGMRFGSDCKPEATHITLTPAADGAVRDGRLDPFLARDGVPDLVEASTFVVNSDLTGVDVRAIIEFAISTVHQPVGQAVLRVPVTEWHGPFSFGPRIDLYTYQGNGAVTLSDFAAGTFTAMYAPVPQTATEITFDVTSVLNSLIASNASYAGFNLRLAQASATLLDPPRIFFGSLESPPAPTLEIRIP